jgi:hypothetical protein
MEQSMIERDTLIRPNIRPSTEVCPTLIAGTVEHGDRRGRELGFPTANLPIEEGIVGDGVWAGTVTLAHGPAYAATVSVGRRVTFYGRQGIRLVEAYLLDFRGDLYGQCVEVRLYSRLRLQRRFPDADALIEQMGQDVQDTREWAATRVFSDGARTAAGLGQAARRALLRRRGRRRWGSASEGTPAGRPRAPRPIRGSVRRAAATRRQRSVAPIAWPRGGRGSHSHPSAHGAQGAVPICRFGVAATSYPESSSTQLHCGAGAVDS